ncbi:MAG: hypothetical protein A3I88_03150 [Candidatus Portnoybacteria bacterium RIFCSPLOWO2_12_FULL_39_9]|uniref:Sortase n=1 Tax=Candidatus Portnoybacteria bacterium RIFCSPHIGHO2_12_FULL_38_9 TaxID=1801997 RepID=A0A1G2FFF6_9BACT|nr:MAG: hypothetical protein A3H00_03155 [Candidatus Portnoybacteria bacterium RBG_13_40_8]OGZ36233.1 MAG: hypothetical protein A2646_02410 [Candidatus Portnoybacteria bacterium RIFCSPHIGHO2_02_FULL_39_12]OGZ36806.1 MAG: hypothetical protein A3J64_02575 [Candidatus Portnoybacteria bacterium RIFCSPHIGHO2_12_FULL_38_9]OGZ38069.1 MAG: hypothetical protein A3F21_00500 [Candidatus Portnoybacteria bacterium RIFCSPLOWO2_01_FULL_38_39]OGZ41099.1 MAG: hypothetical protein A3I88_03150 [Candidatus Portnoy
MTIRLFSIVWLIIFFGVFVFLSWSIFAPQNNWAYGQLPLAQEINPGLNSIFIPKIGLRTPIIFSQSEEEKEIEKDLFRGIVRWPGTAFPGENKNITLVGHSSSYFWNRTSYSRIFANLDKLLPGDTISIFYNGKKFEYAVEKVEIVSSKSVKVLPNEPGLTLITCWPAGTTLKRLAVKAKTI